MKKIYLLLTLSFVLTSCGEDDAAPVTQNTNTQNKVLLLKVDLDTYAFEGGKELTFQQAGTFTLATEQEAGSGSAIIKYSELDGVIFDGDYYEDIPTHINFPESFNVANSFSILSEELEMPALSMFEQIPMSYGVIAPQNMDTHYPLIWDSINNLQVVEEYRESNPDAKVYVFQFGSAVEPVQTPVSWKWYIILKN